MQRGHHWAWIVSESDGAILLWECAANTETQIEVLLSQQIRPRESVCYPTKSRSVRDTEAASQEMSRACTSCIA
jgi:hypothetical protein